MQLRSSFVFLLFYFSIVPDRNTGCCLDPGLSGTSLQRGKGEGRRGLKLGQACLVERERISRNLAEMEET
jgi:hypothetical protein